MTYFEDLTPHTYTECQVERGVLNVGWLGGGHEFPTGEASRKFVFALSKMCLSPIHLHRGFHGCEYCRGKAEGNGQIRVCHANGTWYASPQLIGHYVADHEYLPPADFIDAVCDPLHVAMARIDQDMESWEADIRSVFPEWKPDAYLDQWPKAKEQLQINQAVSGIVVARADFGVWCDIGVGFPALLSTENSLAATYPNPRLSDLPPKGTTVRAKIAEVKKDPLVLLSQV